MWCFKYSESFTSNMVDARMLEHLSKKELEKFLGVTRKFHQASIVHGIHLLRIMKYDRQVFFFRIKNPQSFVSFCFSFLGIGCEETPM